MAQVAREPLGDLNDTVQVVGHELQSQQPGLGIVLGDLAPACGDAFTQWGRLEPGLGMAAVRTANGTQ